MRQLDVTAARLLRFAYGLPGLFRDALLAFRANQGMLLAGAVAFYTLLSLVPLLILILIGLSHVADATALFATLSEYLEFIVPGQGAPVIAQLQVVLEDREAIGGVLLASLIVFSALAFTVLENAMSVIFFIALRFAAGDS